MRLFYKMLFDPEQEKRFFYRIYKLKKARLSTWNKRDIKILRHAGVGGKSHLIAKGHIPWNRKGRW